MSGMNVNPSGSSTTPGDDATYVPDPCLIVTMLREASNFMASRRELLPILSSLARCASLGSLSPSCKCSFIGTASTLQIMAEALGLALPGSALMPATSPDPLAYAREAGRQSVRLAKMKNMKPSDIVTMDIMVLMKTILKIRRKDTQH